MALLGGQHFLELAGEALDEAELRAAGLVRLKDVHLGDVRRADRVDLFYAVAFAVLANGEGLGCASATDTEDQALENLEALTSFALSVHVLNLFMDADDHAGLEFRERRRGRLLCCVGHTIRKLWRAC